MRTQAQRSQVTCSRSHSSKAAELGFEPRQRSYHYGSGPNQYTPHPHPHISPHSHSNRTWTVPVPTGQSWVTIPREQLTMSDELLVWGTKAGQPLWPSVFVNLETRSNRRDRGCAICGVGGPRGPGLMHLASPSSVKPGAPRLYPNVDFSEDEPLEATIHWAPPVWPPHKVLVCQFYYRRCQETTWTLVSVRGPLSPTLFQAGPRASSPNQRPSPEPVPYLPLQSVHISHNRPVHASCSAEKITPHHQII